MVILGGLEIVAAGYLIHKHNQNKRDKQRLEDEAAALEEQQYRIFPSDGRHSSSQHRHSRRRSRSRERQSHGRRRHSTDGRYKHDSPRPSKPALVMAPAIHQAAQPPAYNPIPQTTAQPPPQDMKYGWRDDEPVHGQRPNGQFPPTGWPAEWAQSQTALPNGNLQPPQQRRGRSSRGHSETRSEANTSRVRFAISPSARSASRSPPPSYRN